MAAGVQLSTKYTLIGGPREGRTFSSGAGYTVETPYSGAPGYYATGVAIPNDVGQDGTRAVFNDDTDPDYVGNLTEINGLEGSDVRESYDDNIEEHGAVHGEFLMGRRPVTLSVQVGGNTTVTNRNLRQGRLSAASRALSSVDVSAREAVLRWQPLGYPEMFLRMRRQQRPTTGGVWIKDLGHGFIAADPRIYAVAASSGVLVPAGATTTGRSYDRSYDINYDWAPGRDNELLTNLGDATTPVRITLTGGLSQIALINVTTGEEISLAGTLASGETLVIDTHPDRRSVTLNGNVNAYDRVDLPRTRWWGLVPGANNIQLAAATYDGTATMTVQWRHAWA